MEHFSQSSESLSVNASPESDSNVGDLESDINVGEDRNESLNSFSISPESHSDVNGRAELELGSYNVSLSPETSTHSELQVNVTDFVKNAPKI